MARGTLDALLVPVAKAFGEITSILGVDDGADLIARLGYKLPTGSDLPALFDDVSTSATDLASALEAVVEAYEDGSYDEPSFLQKVLELVAAIVAAAKTADGLPQRAQAAIPDAAFLQGAKIDELPLRLLDFLLVGYLRREQPLLESLLTILGLVTQTPVEEGDYNPYFERIEVRWDRIPKWFTDPKAVIIEEYGWGRDPFRAEVLLQRLNAFMWLSGVYGDLLPLPDPTEAAPASVQLDLPIFRRTIETPLGLAGVLLGLHLRRQDDPADKANSGLAIEPYVDGTFDEAIELRPGWNFVLGAELGAQGFALTIQPSGAQIQAGVGASAALRVGFERDGAAIGPLLLFGSENATRLEIEHLALTFMAAASTSGPPDVGAEVATKGFRLVVQASDGDGFLQAVLPKDPLTIDFDLTIGASIARGVYFAGGAGFEYTFHVNAALGPVFVDSIDLGFKVDGSGATLSVGATGGLEIGPVVAVVEGIGLKVETLFGKRGNLGNAHFQVGFKPPTGIGLSIDTPTVKAGGFLSIDLDRGRYVGAIELSILGKFDLAAIAIITTKRPDGTDGFSLLFIISMTLPVPVPLGYNFYFAGAGGLLGLNRGVDVDYLREGIRTGTADNILFPTDVVRRIDEIVTDLDGSFPQAERQFLVGPMALITWGSPALVSVKVGLIIEIGSPVRIAVLGVLRAALPDAQDPILDLKVAFLGTIDIQAGLLTFDASIFDSFIGRGSFKLYIEGDIALRVCWGARPDFVTSVGGFHPSYTPPAHLKLPAMRRLSLSLLKDNPRIALSIYFAITSNTVQCGARLDFYFKVSKFSVIGDFGFDVLFQFSPFHIDAHVWAGLAVRCGDTDLLSLRLDFNLLGPNPWIARGTASFKILFFEVSVGFEKRFGEEATETLPDIEVLPLFATELGREENWQGQLGDTATTLVTLKPLVHVAGTVVVDAAGSLTVGQRILPLDTDFTLFGTSRPTDAERCCVKALQIGGEDQHVEPIFDDFAPAAFRAMADKDKLAAPAFERRPSGVCMTSGRRLETDQVVARPVAYEQIVSDLTAPGGGTPIMTRGVAERDLPTFGRLVGGGAAGRSSMGRARARRAEAGKVLDIAPARERFAVASSRALLPLDDSGEPAAQTGTDLAGRPIFADGIVTARTDAEQRRAALIARGLPAEDLEIIPEAQLAA